MLRQITGGFPADPQDEKVLAIDKRIPAAYPYHSPPCPGLLQHLRAPLQQGGGVRPILAHFRGSDPPETRVRTVANLMRAGQTRADQPVWR